MSAHRAAQSARIWTPENKRRLAIVTSMAAVAWGAVVFTAVAGDSDPATSSCVGTAPSPGADGQATWTMHCTAPMPTVEVPGPAVTVTTPVPVPGPTFTTTETVTLPPVVSTTTVTVTPAPTTVAPTPTPTPTTTTPPSGGRPNAGNTGVPAGVTLTNYTGSCSITVANTVIDKRTIACQALNIRATGVKITNSRVDGFVFVVDANASLVMTDSEISAPAGQTGIDGSNYTVERVDIFGGNRQGNCNRNCTVKDSWLHGTRIYPASQHASGYRLGSYTTLINNVITCEAAQNSSGGGCSAPITGYPDFQVIRNNTVIGNLIPGSPNSAFCAYGGATAGKPYSGDTNNATYIVFKDNVFGRGTTGKCAMFGPISDFAKNRTGNEWSNNRYEDGTLINV